jgi:hypothetical protein
MVVITIHCENLPAIRLIGQYHPAPHPDWLISCDLKPLFCYSDWLWRFALIWSTRIFDASLFIGSRHVLLLFASLLTACLHSLSTMPGLPHTMPESDEEVQEQVHAVFGYRPRLWQIRVVCVILNGDDVITIAPTGSGKSLTYWMPLLFMGFLSLLH